MNGASRVGSGTLPTISTAWTVAGANDYNGDGKSDIVWHHATNGSNTMWLMNGLTPASSTAVPTIADVNWKPAGK